MSKFIKSVGPAKAGNQEGNSLVHRLRFPEFRSERAWEKRKLSDVLTEHGLKSTGTELVFSVSVHKGIVNQVEHLGRSFSASSTSHYNRVLPGDLVYTKSPTGDFPLGILKQSKQKTEVIVSPLYGVFSPETISLGAILDAYFESPANAKMYLEPLVQKGAKNTINVNNAKFLSGKLHLPIIREEQKKIADCLSSLDALITAQAEKIDALKTHKKGLMQQLFPRDGETVPRLRFLEFRDAGEWEEKTLGQVAAYENGKAHEQDIVEQGRYIVANSKFISTCGEVKKFSNTANLLAKKDDILMVLSDVPNGRAIAKCFYVDKDDTYTVNQRICRLTANQAVSAVLLYLLDRNAYFLAFDDGVKQTNLKKDDVLSCPVLLPEDKTEQQKIADCLSSLDTLITAETEKLDVLKTHKKGLMQQLFPAVEGR